MSSMAEGLHYTLFRDLVGECKDILDTQFMTREMPLLLVAVVNEVDSKGHTFGEKRLKRRAVSFFLSISQ